MWLKKITSARMDRLMFHGALLCLKFLARTSTNPFVAGSATFFAKELEDMVPLFPSKTRKPSDKSSGKRHSI